MKIKIPAVVVSLLFFWVCLTVDAGSSSNKIKSRMMKRLPVIKAMKAKGVIGENNRGYLEYRGPKENADVVKAENGDRRQVYKAIAKQQGASISVVEKHRAAAIEKKANSGEWLQDANGKWYQK